MWSYVPMLLCGKKGIRKFASPGGSRNALFHFFPRFINKHCFTRFNYSCFAILKP